MKQLLLISLLFALFSGLTDAQNTLNYLGLSSSSPAQAAYGLRQLSSSYTGPAIKVRRSADNAEADVAFDGSASPTVSGNSIVTLTPGFIMTTGTSGGAATISTGTVDKTGTIAIQLTKTGTITTAVASTTVTGNGTSFNSELATGDLLFTSANVFLGAVKTIESGTSLTLTNNATAGGTNIAYKSNAVAGTTTNFSSELAVGDRLFKTDNTYLGTVTAIRNASRLNVNITDAVSTAAGTSFRVTTDQVTGTGTNFTSGDVNKVLICNSNNITLGVIASVTNANTITLKQKAGLAVSGSLYRTASGTMTFSAFFTGYSVFVSAWYDQSGYQHDMMQPKSANQPRIVNNGVLNTGTSGKPAVEFSGSLNSYLQTATAASWLTNTLYTQNIVSADVTPVTTYQFVLCTTGGNGPNNTIMHYGYRSSSQYTVAQYGNDQNFEVAATNNLELHTSVKNTMSSSQMYHNGAFLGTLTSGSGSHLTDLGLMNIGFYTPTSNYYIGSVSELTVYALAMGSADLASMNNNQLAYYGIATDNWTGTTDTDWNKPGNWSGGVVPSGTSPSMVVIPNVTNKPVINNSVTANAVNVQVLASASLTIASGGTLQLYGTLSTTSNNCNATNGTVVYKSNSSQSILANTFFNNTVNNLTVSTANGAWVNLNGAITVSGNLTITSSKLVLGTTAVLTLNGTVTNTVTDGIRGNTNASMIVTGTPTLSFDQSGSGSTNILKSLTINSPGTVSFSNSLFLNNKRILTFTAGKLAIGSGGTLWVRGLVVNTVEGGLTGGSNCSLVVDGLLSPRLSIDQTTVGTTNLFNNFTVNTTTGQTTTITGNILVNGTLTTAAGETLNMGTYAIGGTLSTVAGSGTINTQNTFSTPFPSGKSWGGTVVYNAPTSGQTIVSGTYQNLTSTGTGTKTAGGSLVVNGILSNASLLDLTSAFVLSGTLSTITNTGTIKTGVPTSTSVVPIPAGKNWTGTVEYAGTSAQTAVAGIYNNLTISGAGGATSTSNIEVDGILNLSAINSSNVKGCLDVGSNSLTMGGSATTIGTGDVTGIVKRTSFVVNTPYTFGNQFTTVNISAGGTLPTVMSCKIVLTSSNLSWKPNAIHRYYDFTQTTGTSSTLVTLNLHYLDSELNGATEGSLDLFDIHNPTATYHVDDHGHSNNNTSQNWVGLANLSLTYVAKTTFDSKYWTLGTSTESNFTWIGASTDWTSGSNWVGGVVPASGDHVIIPDAGTTDFDPVIPATAAIGSIDIQAGGILNGGTGSVLTIDGAAGSWENLGIFNAGESTIKFTNSAATMADPTYFYNVTVADGAKLTLGTDNFMGIAGTLSLSTTGVLNAANNRNTIEYNGSGAQTVISPNGSTPGYHNLILSGNGTKTLPGTALTVAGDFTMAGSASATATTALSVGGNVAIGTGTTLNLGSFNHTIAGNLANYGGTLTPSTGRITFNGTSLQTITSAAGITFNNVAITNTTANITLGTSTDCIIAGNLTLASGAFFNLATNKLTSVAGTITSSGTIRTQNSSSTPFPTGKTWGGTIEFSGNTAQTIVAGTYDNLTISGTGGVTSNSDLTVNGILNLPASNPASDKGCLDLGANTLSMGGSAITTGTGDVTGIVKRTSFVANTPYTFGNQFTTINLASGGTLPTEMSCKIVLTASDLSWKPNSIHRYYDFIQTTGTSATMVTMNLHYLDSELNGSAEGSLDLFDIHNPTATYHVDDHGHSDYSTSQNWVGLANLSLTYVAKGSFDNKYWTLGANTSDNFTWLGQSTEWNSAFNWVGGNIPAGQPRCYS